MPQVQVLPQVPGFGTQLAQVLAQAGGDIGQGLLQRRKNQSDANLQAQIESGKLSPVQMATAVSKLSPERQEAYKAFLKEQAKSANNMGIINQIFGIDQPQPFQAPPSTDNQPIDQSQMQPGFAQNQQPIAQNGIDLQNPGTWPEEILIKASGLSDVPGDLSIVGNIAKTELKNRQAGKQLAHEDVKKSQEKVSNLRESIPKKRMALNFAKNAVESKEVGIFSKANLAKTTGINAFQTAKGAQLVTAGKENLLSNMSRVSAKAQNIWFEQRLNSMFPDIGTSEEANETILAMIDGELRLDEAFLDAYSQLEDQDMRKFGYVKGDVEKRAYQQIAPMEKQIMDKTSYKLREIYENEKGGKWLSQNFRKQVPKGTPLTLNMAKVLLDEYGGDSKKVIENAEKYGYLVPTAEEYRKWAE